MSKITSIVALLLISLIFFSLSLPSSAEDQPAATSVPHSRDVQVHEESRFVSSVQRRKLKNFMKKGFRSRGFGTGIATRARARTSSAYRTNLIIFFSFWLCLGLLFFLGFLVL